MNRHALAAAALAATFTITPAANAVTPSADSFGWWASVRHYSPDRGYDKPIKLRCQDDGRWFLLYEGQDSTDKCDDVGALYVRAGETVVYKTWSGWHVWATRKGATVGAKYNIYDGTHGQWAVKIT